MGRSLTEMVPRRGQNRLVVADAYENRPEGRKGRVDIPPDTWYAEVCRWINLRGDVPMDLWWSLSAEVWIQPTLKKRNLAEEPDPDQAGSRHSKDGFTVRTGTGGGGCIPGRGLNRPTAKSCTVLGCQR